MWREIDNPNSNWIVFDCLTDCLSQGSYMYRNRADFIHIVDSVCGSTTSEVFPSEHFFQQMYCRKRVVAWTTCQTTLENNNYATCPHHSSSWSYFRLLLDSLIEYIGLMVETMLQVFSYKWQSRVLSKSSRTASHGSCAKYMGLKFGRWTLPLLSILLQRVTWIRKMPIYIYIHSTGARID